MKRKSNEQSLDDVIQDYLRESGWQQKLDEIKIITEWDKVLGPTLAKYTDELFIKNKQLHYSEALRPFALDVINFINVQLEARVNFSPLISAN